MKNKKLIKASRLFMAFAVVLIGLGGLVGCSAGGDKVKFDPGNPVTITVWHYYNGTILNAFDNMVQEFNSTIGMEKGIIVEGFNYGNVGELEKAMLSSARKDVGSLPLPNVFTSYADTAYEAEKLGILANLDDYFTAEEQSQYVDSYIEEGKIGLNGELRILPIAKSTEIFMLNDTDWRVFAEANNLSYDNLGTLEGLAEVAELYYQWTDAKTDTPYDGKAFYGRDSIANMFIIASKEYGTEIFQVEEGKCTLNINEEVMRKLWDNYYVPYISGYFANYGKFASDDTKVGDNLAYVGSTASASYFPKEVTAEGKTYPVEAKILPAPHLENGKPVMVQQGAGMAVTKATKLEEAASVEFLKYFTDVDNNIAFSSMSAYMPVKKEAMEYDILMTKIRESGQTVGDVADATLKIALEEIKTNELYTNKAFSGGTAGRDVLNRSLQEKAVTDAEAVRALIIGGVSLPEAVAGFNTEDNFKAWLEGFSEELHAAVVVTGE